MEIIKKMSRIIFTNGCFDGGLHVGHFNLLTKCRNLAGTLGKVIVAIDGDKKVRADKGKTRPLYIEKEREAYLKACIYPYNGLDYKMIDDVLFFDTNEELYELIKRVDPDIIVKGSDWKGNVIGSDLAEVIHVELYPISVTKTEQRIVNTKQLYNFNPEL